MGKGTRMIYPAHGRPVYEPCRLIRIFPTRLHRDVNPDENAEMSFIFTISVDTVWIKTALRFDLERIEITPLPGKAERRKVAFRPLVSVFRAELDVPSGIPHPNNGLPPDGALEGEPDF